VSMDRLAFFNFMKDYGDFIVIEVKVLLNYFYKVLLKFFLNLKKVMWVLLENRLNNLQKTILMKIGSFFLFLINFFIKIIKKIKPFLKVLIIIIATLCFIIKWFNMKRIYDHVRIGYVDLVIPSTIIEYFV